MDLVYTRWDTIPGEVFPSQNYLGRFYGYNLSLMGTPLIDAKMKHIKELSKIFFCNFQCCSLPDFLISTENKIIQSLSY